MVGPHVPAGGILYRSARTALRPRPDLIAVILRSIGTPPAITRKTTRQDRRRMGWTPHRSEDLRAGKVKIMRRILRRVALACVLAIGGLVGFGTTSAQAQGFGGYPG